MTVKTGVADFKFSVDRTNKKITMERIFEVPPELVYKAHTDANLIPKWWTNTRVEELDVRVGGKWKFVSEANGREMITSGVFKDVMPNKKIVETFNTGFNEFINTTTFENAGHQENRTKLTKIVEFATTDDLENMVKYGMEQQAKAGYEILANILFGLRADK